MNVIQRHRVRDAFACARDYDRHARVQRIVARRLAWRIAALELPRPPRILEIGCGTGFLTAALIEAGIAGDWLVSDIAPDMVERCKARVGEADGRRFAVLDGEYGEPDGETAYDLICSSLVMQWFEDQPRALARMAGWLAPGGHCLFTTLGTGSFAEWRRAHEAEGLTAGTPRFPILSELDVALPGARWERLEAERFVERHDSALHFVRSLRAIGAGTSAPDHRPLGPAELRRVMHCFEAQGAAVGYEVVFGHFRREP